MRTADLDEILGVFSTMSDGMVPSRYMQAILRMQFSGSDIRGAKRQGSLYGLFHCLCSGVCCQGVLSLTDIMCHIESSSLLGNQLGSRAGTPCKN